MIFKEIKTGEPVDAVRVTAADYCSTADPQFDGCPFSETPDWLLAALDNKITLYHNDDRDYALWKVDGVMAEPGDRIIQHIGGKLSVCLYDDFPKQYEEVV